MSQTLKIAIPMAGLGTRMRPHTWSKPKPLVRLAGKTVLDYVLGQFDSLPDQQNVEYVFIIGPQGEQIKTHMEKYHPHKKTHYVVQADMRGQSDALYQARQYLTGPMLMCFSDTLIETDLSFLKDETSDGIGWVKPVPDPRRFGVAVVNNGRQVERLVEKPQDISNNLALVGFYYFRSSEALLDAIEEQMRRDIMLKNEYFLVDAINIMLERDAKILTREVEEWLDAGTPEALLETNRFFLEYYQAHDAEAVSQAGVTIIPPVFIPDDAQVESSVIGPYVSIGKNCHIRNAIISNSIIDEGAQISKLIIEDSLIGSNVKIQGRSEHINLGDDSWVIM